MRLVVLSTFAKLLPEATIFPDHEVEMLYTRFIKGIGWSSFLARVIHYHRAHFVFLPNGGSNSGGIWPHKKSVFNNLQDNFESSYLTTLTRRGSVSVSSRFCGHWHHFDSPVKHRASACKEENLKNSNLSLRFFVPLLVWSYNQCKECLVLLDALIAQHQEDTAPDLSTADRMLNPKAEIDYSTVFLHGSATKLRRNHQLAQIRTSRANAAELPISNVSVKEDVVRDSTGQINNRSTAVHNAKAGEEGHSMNDLLKERSIFLNKFNLIRKCLMILTNDDVLNIVLNFNVSSSVDTHFNPTSTRVDPGQMEFIGREAESRLAAISLCLHACDADYDSNKGNLTASERELDDFISKTINSGSFYCEDYGILLDLLDKLNPVGVDASDT